VSLAYCIFCKYCTFCNVQNCIILYKAHHAEKRGPAENSILFNPEQLVWHVKFKFFKQAFLHNRSILPPIRSWHYNSMKSTMKVAPKRKRIRASQEKKTAALRFHDKYKYKYGTYVTSMHIIYKGEQSATKFRKSQIRKHAT
jgi:hypothetical protein